MRKFDALRNTMRDVLDYMLTLLGVARKTHPVGSEGY